ncbi:aminopeptidase N [Sphingomicrobium astaxanthinifaciens]|uniref:aminopeptidase N n=1 Tax=Sphingomicrobium astaxanthinifaciens TaxID=1227949 RepID=UPI001FCC37A9|nr:aminopeptidase N [Sphingomicrobium astaxanthinifaciens]MCJ7421459.1 aminopeptidase N [Sphingomicrobium astaxanthinifaciens]
MADARMNPEAPPAPDHAAVYRKDYEPPAWWVRHVDLDIDLDPKRTRVRATLDVEKNRGGPLRLAGDELKPLAVQVDGQDARWTLDGDDLVIELEGERHEVVTTVEIDPSANSQLMGLYASGGLLCTQCESEGFRRITFHPDRPDVLSTYCVTMHADAQAFPILLANGNKVAEGKGEDGRHWARWEDPFPKPSYLFALVAGDLAANSDRFTTMSGREVALNIWVREKDLPRTHHAMRSLKDAMRWDEQTYGREYDLDLFNIVAVDDFNFGAMENKGLNIFNSRYVLADAETATDMDFDGIAGVVAHEYFHNWSGNRVTCRDWFQLSLKEGFTVFRDQCFSQDMNSAAVKRIEDVRLLRAVQFPEDNGPLAHPVRPDSYIEISNFYTATVYNKGAELIRMMRTILGAQAFRKGADLYFERHDGEAATCEDFVRAMEDASGEDLTQFRLWYSQAGTPRVSVHLDHDAAAGTCTLRLRQEIPDTPGQSDKAPMAIPLKLALLDPQNGAELAGGERLVMLTEPEQQVTYDAVGATCPIVSLNRDFSAPIILKTDREDDELAALARVDGNAFARFEALQELALRAMLPAIEQGAALDPSPVIAAIEATLDAPDLDQAFKAEAIMLPAQGMIGERLEVIDPDKVHEVRRGLAAAIGRGQRAGLERLLAADRPAGDDLSVEAKGRRALRNVALGYLAAGDAAAGAALAKAQYDAARNMTERQGALAVLANLEQPQRGEALDDFYARYKDNNLVLDKWFGLQARAERAGTLEEVARLAEHPDFTLKNPNRLRALMSNFTANQWVFHHASGRGYELLADMIIAADRLNPQVAARLVPPLGRWKRFEPARSAMMRAALERIMETEGLSKDVFEQVSKSLS